MRWPTLPCPLQSHSTVRILQFCLWLISWNVRQLHYKYLFQMFQWVICASSFFVFYTGGPGQLPINWSVKTAILCPRSLTGFLSGKPAGSLNVEQYERRSRCQQPGVKILNNRSKGQKGEEGSKRERERESSPSASVPAIIHLKSRVNLRSRCCMVQYISKQWYHSFS